MGGFWLLAQWGGRGGDPLRSPEVIWGTAGLALALLAGALLVYLTDRWRKRNSRLPMDAAAELTEFRRMFDRGEITEEEYVRLRDRVAQRVKAPSPGSATVLTSHLETPSAELTSPNSLPGPDQPTPSPDPGKPANPSSPD
jgi:hypothetical protein